MPGGALRFLQTMARPDLDPEQLFRGLARALRDAGVEAGQRRELLRRAGCLLELDHGQVEQLLREDPREGETEALFDALFELAARRSALDELGELLDAGAAGPLGVEVDEFCGRLSGLAAQAAPPPARQRGGEGFGVLRALFEDDGPLLLGSDHGPSTRCPACTADVPLGKASRREESRRGVYSEHPVACERCGCEGSLRRFYSFRLRGHRDAVTLRRPGWLGPFASPGWALKVGLLFVGLALGLTLGGRGARATCVLHAGSLLVLRGLAPGQAWQLALAGLGVLGVAVGAAHAPDPAGWAVAGLLALAGLAHALWAAGARPTAWSFEGRDL